MRAPVALLAALVAAALMLAAGCGGETSVTAPSRAAPPQSAEVGWIERYPATGGHLVFRVARIEVLAEGWRAEISVTNNTSVGFDMGDPRASATRQWGVMLFRSGDLRELEQRSRAGELPGVRHAERYRPPLAVHLPPGDTWSGTISARGSLAAGRFLRVVFGALVPVDEVPGIPGSVVWITDSAYALRGPD